MRGTFEQRVSGGFVVSGALALVILLTCQAAQALSVNENLFIGEMNRFVGMGGESLINSVLSGDDPATPGFDPDGVLADPDLDGPIPPHVIERLDVGDRLVGIGTSLSVEGLSSVDIRTLGVGGVNAKYAARAMQVTGKVAGPDGFSFRFGPLSPVDYSETVAIASDGSVVIPPASIPVGTMVLSFDDSTPGFTLLTVPGSPGTNWAEATDGVPFWNVGIADPDDFWVATFPSDDLGLLPLLPPSVAIGTINFGLSLLPGGTGWSALAPVFCEGPTGLASVDFYLSGVALGTLGIDTPFPIGLQTEVIMHPVPEPGAALLLVTGLGVLGLWRRHWK